MENNWHKSVAYLCGWGTPPSWMKKYHWKWAANRDMLKLLDTFFGLHLELENVNQFLVAKVMSKLKY